MFAYDLAHTRFNPHEHILSPTNVSHLVHLWSAACYLLFASGDQRDGLRRVK